MPISGQPLISGRGDVRKAVQNWFSGHTDGLTQVHRSKPRNVKPGAYFAQSGDQTGAIAYVYIEDEHETRVSGPFLTGWKLVTYAIGLRVTFRSLLSDTEAGIDAYDATIEAIKARLRVDPQLGTGGFISFVAGEGGTVGAPDIEVISDDSHETNTTTTIEAIVRFEVVSMINA